MVKGFLNKLDLNNCSTSMAIHGSAWECMAMHGYAVQYAWLCKAMASGGSDCHTGESSAREEVGEVGAILYPVRTS
jgi:hypothetical protein